MPLKVQIPRERILETALQLVIREGPQCINIKRVAQELGGVTVQSIIASETGMTTDQIISALAVWALLSAADAVLAWFAVRYFKNELAAGTLFTLAGAKELLRLGILTITLPLGSYIAAKIVNGILAVFLSNTWDAHVDQGGAVIIGVMFLVLSVVLKYGAELEDDRGEEPYADPDY